MKALIALVITFAASYGSAQLPKIEVLNCQGSNIIDTRDGFDLRTDSRRSIRANCDRANGEVRSVSFHEDRPNVLVVVVNHYGGFGPMTALASRGRNTRALLRTDRYFISFDSREQANHYKTALEQGQIRLLAGDPLHRNEFNGNIAQTSNWYDIQSRHVVFRGN